MPVSELSPEQIGAIAAGATTIIGIVIAAARKAASGSDAPEQVGGRSNPYLLLDAKLAKDLAEQMGALTVHMVKLTLALERAGEASDRTIKAIEKNTAAALDVIQAADKLTDEVQELRVQTAINNRGPRSR